jgi:hypothetical protein
MRSPTSRLSNFVVHAKLFTFTCVTASLVHIAVFHLNRQLTALTQSITIEQYFSPHFYNVPTHTSTTSLSNFIKRLIG